VVLMLVVEFILLVPMIQKVNLVVAVF
jgi:hypothetical protein